MIQRALWYHGLGRVSLGTRSPCWNFAFMARAWQALVEISLAWYPEPTQG